MAIVRLEELGKLKISNNLIGNRSRDLLACSIVPQLTTLPRALICMECYLNLYLYKVWKYVPYIRHGVNWIKFPVSFIRKFQDCRRRTMEKNDVAMTCCVLQRNNIKA
jgi:hypothetical protein